MPFNRLDVNNDLFKELASNPPTWYHEINVEVRNIKSGKIVMVEVKRVF